MSLARWTIIGVICLFAAIHADAARIGTRGNSRPTSGTYSIQLSSRGHRQMMLMVDPNSRTNFRLEWSYSSNLLNPVGLMGFDQGLSLSAIEYTPPSATLEMMEPAMTQSEMFGFLGGTSPVAAKMQIWSTGFNGALNMPVPNAAEVSGRVVNAQLFQFLLDRKSPDQGGRSLTFGGGMGGGAAGGSGGGGSSLADSSLADSAAADANGLLSGSMAGLAECEALAGQRAIPALERGSQALGNVPVPAAVWMAMALGMFVIWRNRSHVKWQIANGR